MLVLTGNPTRLFLLEWMGRVGMEDGLQKEEEGTLVSFHGRLVDCPVMDGSIMDGVGMG